MRDPAPTSLHFERHGWDQRWYSQWYDGAESLAAATPITIADPGEVVGITAHLREGGRISGRVLRAGQPDYPLWITVWRSDGAPSVSNGGHTSSSDDTFEVVGLNDGDYQVGDVVNQTYLENPRGHGLVSGNDRLGRGRGRPRGEPGHDHGHRHHPARVTGPDPGQMSRSRTVAAIPAVRGVSLPPPAASTRRSSGPAEVTLPVPARDYATSDGAAEADFD